MKYKFKDLTNMDLYSSARVLFVFGQYNLFNNIAIDSVRDICKPEKIENIDTKLLSDFGIDESESNITLNTLDLETFTKVIHTVCINGKWFTSANYSFISKKQKDWINNYIKSPSDNGKLVVYCTEFKDYRALLKNKIISNSNFVHAIQLNYPYRSTLETIVRQLFLQRGVKVQQRAIELFIMRMSNSYDDYEETIDKIVSESVPVDTSTGEVADGWKYTITYEDAFSAMKGIENFILDDFIDRLLIPLDKDNPNFRNKVFKMWVALTDEMGPQQLVNKLKYKIDDYIEFRLAINSGIIPIKVRFSVPEAKKRLGEEHKLSKFSDYSFRKMATIASKTSLLDWEYMKLILSNTNYSRESYEKVLYSLINRTILNEARLNSDIRACSLSSYSELNRLSKISYSDSIGGSR